MFTGQRAVVTGASRGIGRELCIRLAQLGYSVTLVSRNKDLLSDLTAQLPIDRHQSHRYVALDLRNLLGEASSSEAEQVATELSVSSLLVNCAGISNHALLPKLSNEVIRSTIMLNLVAPIMLSKMAIKPFLKQSKKISNRPSILNISSMLSVTGETTPGTSVYAASKAGLLGFTQSLAGELGGKVRVNAILPALIPETDMGKSGSPKLPKVSLGEVVECAEKIILDDTMNGSFIQADNTGCKRIN